MKLTRFFFKNNKIGTNKTRVVKRTVPADTFFTFFSPPVFPGENEELDEEEAEGLDAKLEADYEMGKIHCSLSLFFSLILCMNCYLYRYIYVKS